MKIKLSQSKVLDNSSYRQQPSNPEATSNRSINKGIVFQSQFNSIQNYFSLLHHIFGRNSNAKQLLRSVTAKEDQIDTNMELEIKDIKVEEEDGIDNSSKTIASKATPSPKRSLQFSNTRYDNQKPKWKDSILRRKNNGTHGEIVKGKPKDRYSSLIHKACLTEMKPSEIEVKEVQKYTNEHFIPIGSMLTQCSKNIISFKSFDGSETEDNKEKIKSSTRGKSNKRYMLTHYQRKSKIDERRHYEQQLMNKTCLPFKISGGLKEKGKKLLRKTVISSPYRYKSQMSTPCAWEYTSQR